MTSSEFIEGFPGFDWRQTGTVYRAKAEDSDEFSDIFNEIALNRGLELDTSKTDPVALVYVYTDGELEVTLTANFDEDLYIIAVGDR